ncbi:pentatricopeptide repeat-containing protein At1g73710 [Telopea speciosissima]|uniref:pentatricopeptide repeat-containing protein At1g73710 n=1 Tax=Telopea speciosissima TaxID=54955 RepID=UPI001CC7A2A9|nr:pentatricopeptide repeat-containing protein At1g73710 [Telopea speciosissima]
MMLHCYNSREIGRDNIQNSVQFHVLSPCKLQNLQSRFITRVSLGSPKEVNASSESNLHCQSTRDRHSKFAPLILPAFGTEQNLHTPVRTWLRRPNPRGTKISVGFKLHCHTRPVVSATKSPKKTRKKADDGPLHSILSALKTKGDISEILNSWIGKLSPKEQTVILREQRDWERVLLVFRWMKSQKDYVPNVIHYNVVLRSLGRAQRWDELRLCWIEMAKEGVLPTNNTYGMLVDVYGKAGLGKEALLWLRHMRLRGLFPDEVTMNTVVRVLKEAGEFDLGEKFFKDWCAGQVDLDHLDLNSNSDLMSESDPISLKHFLSTELFKAGGRIPTSKMLSSAAVIESSVQKPRLAATYNTLIDLYGKAGRLKDAADAFAEMLKAGVEPDIYTFNTMIFICGAHEHLAEAEALLSKMEERGISPDTKTYNIFLSLYANVGDIDAALNCYRKIREVGLFPDTVTHRAVLHVLCKRNMVQEVESVIKEMDKSGLHIDEHSLPPIVKMYVEEGFLDRAMILLGKYQFNDVTTSKTFAAVIDAFAGRGLWKEAEAVFSGNKDSSGHKKDVLQYNVMIKAYGKAKLYDSALSLFRNMRSNGTWPDECTYNSLIQMLSGGDLVDQAREFLAEMQEVGFKPRCATFSAVIACYARLGKVSEAVDVYKEMYKAGVEPNEVIYGSLINGFAEARKVDEAFYYFHVMEESGIPVNHIVLTSLIKAYSKVGCLEGAQKLYEKMKDLEGGPDIVASNSMINLYADLGMVSEAKLIFDNLRQNGQADGVSFATMMYLYKSIGLLDEAIDIAHEMQLSGLLRDCPSFNTVMASYATNGQLRECGELLHQMVTQKILPDSGTFKIMFTVLKKGGLPVEAVMQLQLSYSDGNPYSRQAIIASVFCIVGLHAFALEACETFTKAEVGLDSSIYNVAIYIYGSSGEVNKALNIFMKMQDGGLEPDIVTFINLADCYGKAGMVEGVRRIYNQLKFGEIRSNESLFRAIISAYKSANRYDLAEMVCQEMKFTFNMQEHSDLEKEVESDEGISIPIESTDLMTLK